MKEVFSNYKRCLIYLLICFPVVAILSLLLVRTGMELWLNVLICVISAGALCFIFEIVYVIWLRQKIESSKNAKKEKDNFSK